MALSLNHFSIRSSDLPACEALLLLACWACRSGPRPPFDFSRAVAVRRRHHRTGANAVVHILGVDRKDPEGLKQLPGRTRREQPARHRRGRPCGLLRHRPGRDDGAPAGRTRRRAAANALVPLLEPAPGLHRRPQRRGGRAQLPRRREGGARRLEASSHERGSSSSVVRWAA